MRAFLEAKKGPGQGRKITLREGQTLYVGRTEQADIPCPENPEMSAVHFSIRWVEDYCQFKDLNSANGSFCNGKRVQEVLVHHGDEIKAGQTTFRLVIGDNDEGPTIATDPVVLSASGQHLRPESDAAAPSFPVAPNPRKTTPPPAAKAAAPAAMPAGMPTAEGSVGLLIPSAAEVAQIAPIDYDNKKLATRDQDTPQFVQMLTAHEKFMDAVRVLAFAMGKLTVIEWAHKCVTMAYSDGLPQLDAKTLDLVHKWLGNRTEELRRACYAHAQEAEHGTPASWVAMAAFWSEGSQAPPPPSPPVAPGPTQCAHAATGAILLAAVARQPEKAPDRYRAFIQAGLEMLQS
jgi:hypothetical protein